MTSGQPTRSIPPEVVAMPARGRRWVRRVVGALVVVAVLAVAGLAAVSWHYSNQIDAEVIQAPTVGPWPDQFTVAAVDPGAGTVTMTLRPGVWDRDLVPSVRSSKVYGLHWDGGFATSTGPGTQDGDRFTRAATVVEGQWPAVGAAIGLDPYAHPRAMAPDWQSVAIPTDGGSLPCYLSSPSDPPGPGESAAAAPTGTTWAVLVHGQGGEPAEFDRMRPSIVAAGFTALAISYRGDPGAPPAPRGHSGYGTTEWVDLRAAVGYARDHGARRIVLMGISMGGAVIASYLRHEHDPSIAGIVLDAPALSMPRTAQWQIETGARSRGLPFPAPLLWSTLWVTSRRFGVDWAATDYLTDPSWDSVPTLLFQGADDATVPPATSREFAAARANVTLVEVPGADHVESWNVDPAAYDRRLSTFLTTVATGPG